MFAALFLGRIEWKFDGVSEVSTSGPFALMLLVLALVIIGMTSGVLPQPFARRRDPSSAEAILGLTLGAAETPKAEKHGFFQSKETRELRRHLRRGGDPKPVRIRMLDDAADEWSGVVTDRSRGGLQISVPVNAVAGDHFRVRSVDAPDDIDWVVVQVRHCRKKGDGWLWGCKFTRELPWGELLLFG